MADELKARALRLLAQREHSRAELARKLSGHAPPEEIDILLDRLTELDLLSDARFAASYVRAKAPRFGVARLRHELAQRGIAPELIDLALSEALGEGKERADDELARAREIWLRKFGSAPTDAREWARQARFLQGRGFSAGLIRTLLKDPDA